MAVLALCTGVSELVWPHLDAANIIMVYLAGVVYVALHEAMRVSVATVLGSILLFDFLYVEPRWGFKPVDPTHLFTFAVMLGVGLLISQLAAKARERQTLAEQAQTERLRSTLLAGISHDLRTPLTTIVGTATSLLDQGERMQPAQRAVLTRGLVEQAMRLQRQMGDLLDLVRFEEGAMEPAYEWCPADELVAQALAPLAGRGSDHPIGLEIDPDALVWCDPRLIEQAIFNLVDNALRHTPAGTPVRLAVQTAGEACRLVVSDAGPGLPPGREQALLRKFQRGHSEPSGGGFGLGLALCAAVAHMHGGRLEAVNDGGAQFTMHLPQPPKPRLEDA